MEEEGTRVKKLRILFVAEEFWPKAAGGEVWAWDLTRELARRGHRVTALTSAQNGLPADERRDGVRILRRSFPARSRPLRLIRNKALQRYVRTLLSTEKFDIVHTAAYTMNVPVSRIAKRAGVPCITAAHSYFGDDWKRLSPLWPLLRALERRTLRHDASSILHVPSAYLDARIRADMGDGKLCSCLKRKLRVIPNWCPDRYPKPHRFPTPTLLFVGSLEPVKDPLTCIAVAKRLTMPLVVVGTGLLERALLREAARAGIALTVLPHASRDETLAMIGGASLVLVPSVTESFSLVALEAVAQRTPVAGRPVGILPALPGVIAWPPTRVPKRLTATQANATRKRFSKRSGVDAIERAYRELVRP